ncbi:DUF4188 domain-containing protein [Kribbella sp. NPDC056861]|uniref:DUF4188 domain-containing protein n=1 Tax=Kribbella sp. NPDC056861 TaxID=3154857 RepID=UPI003427676A
MIPGRQTAAYDKDLVVFVIGFRVNKFRAFKEWLPVARAMPPMLRELVADQDSGLLGFRTFPGLRTTTMIQYWESVEKLQAFANDPDRTHRPAWTNFFKYAYKSNNVGIYHETFVVPAGHSETIYGNMPLIGLGKVAGVVPVNKRGDTAAERLGGREL